MDGFSWATYTKILEEDRLELSADPEKWEEDADYFRFVIINPGFQLYFSMDFNNAFRFTVEFPTYSPDGPLKYVSRGLELDAITDEEGSSINYYLTSAVELFDQK